MRTPAIAASISQQLEAFDMPATGDLRYIPTSFDPDDELLRAYPVFPDRQWESLKRLLTEERARGVMSRLPSFWQANFTIFEASKDLEVPLFTCDPENMPLASAALRTTGIDTLVTTVTDATAFLHYLSERSVQPPASILAIGEIHDVPARILTSSHVRYELHLIPGVVVLDQCRALSGHKGSAYHISEEVAIEELSPLTITIGKAGPIPLTSVRTGHATQESGTCACGRMIYEL